MRSIHGYMILENISRVVLHFQSFLVCRFATLVMDSRHTGSLLGANSGRNHHFGGLKAVDVSFSLKVGLLSFKRLVLRLYFTVGFEVYLLSPPACLAKREGDIQQTPSVCRA